MSSTKYDNSYDTPVLTAGQIFILGYTDEATGIFSASPENPVIIFDDFTAAFKWVDFSFKAKSSAMKMLRVKDEQPARLRFYWHYMQTIHYLVLEHSRQWIGTYSQIEVPIPPLEVQDEIVRILDSFTKLESELEARRHQYTHYRDQLLDFTRLTEREERVTWLTLGDIVLRTYSGTTPLTSHVDYYNGSIPWLRTQEVRFNEIYDTERRITQTAMNETAVKWVPANCVIVAISGATAGRSSINKIPLTTNQHCFCMEINPDKALYKYVFYWTYAKYEQLKGSGQGARADINSSIIKNLPIAIPSLALQKTIVTILDKFSALTEDVSGLLPEEIRLCQKQFEFYRDSLLAFTPKASKIGWLAGWLAS